MFIYNPDKRINAVEALRHDYFRGFNKDVVPAIGEENVGFLYDKNYGALDFHKHL